MRPSHSRFAATIIVGLFVAAACSSAASPLPVLTPTPSLSEARLTPSTIASPTPVLTPTPTPVGPPTADPTRSDDATLRVVELTAILDVAQADRFETFGDK